MRFWLACLLIFVTSACNLTSMSEGIVVTATDTSPQVTMSPSVVVPLGTVTRALAATPTQFGAGGNLSAGCVPRSDWTATYTIASGDTLVSIADEVGITYTELAQGNCIDNPDNIDVGQALRVPRPIGSSAPPVVGGIGTGTYTNATLGIALDLPANWSAQDSGYITLSGPDGNLIEIMYSNAGEGTTAEEAVQQCENFRVCLGDRTITNRQSFTLPSGISGIWVDFSADFNDGDPGPSVAAFMVVNTRQLSMRTFNDQSIFNTILNSLRPI